MQSLHRVSQVDSPPPIPPLDEIHGINPSAGTEPEFASENAEDDLIKVEYHPHCKRSDELLSLYEYRNRREKVHLQVDEEPWLPFSTRADYEYADITLEAGLNASQSSRLILLIQRIAKGEKFTLRNHAEVQKVWKEASSKLAEVSQNNYFASLYFYD